eukprot:Phypoly_transcript_12295.p1 GENE.Phypoly_transcript_12295~~Phypoly_transcript_12295.p1  ORF type:complete len:351 (+),score=35.67 Phypoly_transcript_12295:59-1111(+)
MVQVYTWGLDPLQQQIKDKKCCLPKLVTALQDKDIVQVVAGSHCNAALARDGSVYTWGKGGKGRLGHNSEEDKLVPTKVKGLDGCKIKKVTTGAWHMGALSDQGDIFLWGSFSKSGTTFIPQKVNELKGRKAADIGCGQLWNAIVLESGELVILDKQGKVREFSVSKFVAVWCGSDFGVALDDKGAIWLFGTKIEHTIYGSSKPHQSDLFIPTPLDLSSINGRVVQCGCSTGEFHQSIGILTDTGEVYMWGSNYKGKLGVGDFEDRKIPTKVNFEGRVVDLHIGGIHAAIVTSDHNLLTFGCGSDGRLGHPESKDHRYLFHETVPRLVNALEHRALQISCSYYHCIAIAN